MRKALFLTVSFILIAMAFTSTGRANRSSDCPTPSCLYLPLIGNPPIISVFEIRQWPTRAGTYRFIGDVIASRPIYDVVVEVRFVNGDHKFSGFVVLKASLPGQLNPFDIYTNVENTGIIPVEASVIDWKEESEQIYRNAAIISISYEEDYSGTGVIVEVRNDEASPLLDVKGVIWGLDQITAIGAKDITNRLDPGETATFSSFLLGTHYIPNIRVSAQGILQP